MNTNYPILFEKCFFYFLQFLIYLKQTFFTKFYRRQVDAPLPLSQSRLFIYKVNPMRLEAVFVMEWLGVDKTMDVGIAQ